MGLIPCIFTILLPHNRSTYIMHYFALSLSRLSELTILIVHWYCPTLTDTVLCISQVLLWSRTLNQRLIHGSALVLVHSGTSMEYGTTCILDSSAVRSHYRRSHRSSTPKRFACNFRVPSWNQCSPRDNLWRADNLQGSPALGGR